MAQCQVCGKEFDDSRQGKRGRKTKFCSDACRQGRQAADQCLRRSAQGGAENGARRSCKCCGRVFTVKRRGQGYCSSECGRKARLAERIDLQCLVCGKTFVRRAKAIGTRWYCSAECRRKDAKAIKSTLWIGTCRVCGAEFEGDNVGKTKKQCCSPKCASKWQAQQLRHEFVCKHCGKTYRTAYANRNQYCSNECRFNAWHDKALRHKADREAGVGSFCKVYFINCIECGKLFSAHTKAKAICGTECQTAINRRAYGARNEHKHEPITATCARCGRKFAYLRFNRTRLYCSKECNRRANEEADPERYADIRAKARHKRRALQESNGPVDAINPRHVFERDGWRCGICGRKVNPGLKFPHPRSPSLDHIIALAAGGSHTWDNLQCAHFICNSMKRDLPGGQLRLSLT
jgi:hypothetical protein